MTRELSSWAAIMPARTNQQVRLAAQEFMKDCIVEIDNQIYSQPAPENYKRTNRLRKGHELKQLAQGVYLVSNLVSYAVCQHDGWTDRSGVWHAGRPWMDTAMRNNEAKYEHIIDQAVMDLWNTGGGGAVSRA